MKLTAVFNGIYKKTNAQGKLVDRYRYIVTGDKDALEMYAAVKGQYYMENEEGQPLFLTQNFVGQRVDLKFTYDGNRVYPDTSSLDIAKNLIAQNEGPLAVEMAKLVAAQLLGQAFNTSTPKVEAKTAETKEAETSQNLDE